MGLVMLVVIIGAVVWLTEVVFGGPQRGAW